MSRLEQLGALIKFKQAYDGANPKLTSKIDKFIERVVDSIETDPVVNNPEMCIDVDTMESTCTKLTSSHSSWAEWIVPLEYFEIISMKNGKIRFRINEK